MMPMDCSLPGFSVHGILQVRKLEWVAISFFRGSSQHSDQAQVSSIAGRFCTTWAAREAPILVYVTLLHLFIGLNLINQRNRKPRK